MGFAYFILREEIFSSIKELKNPRKKKCSSCRTELELKHKRANRNSKFWGCPSWPRCNYTEDYFFEDRLAFIDFYNPNAKRRPGFSGELFRLKYEYTDKKLVEKFSENLYQTIESRIGHDEFDFFITIPDSYGRENPVIKNLYDNGHLRHLKYLQGAVQQVKAGSQKTAGTLENRIRNAQGKYQIRDKQSIRGSRVLILDDVVTSGATMHEVSWMIREENQQASYAASIGKNKRGR